MAKIAAIFQLLDKNVTVSSHRLELLSPARDAAIAREAILHGADAVYIGGEEYGLRAKDLSTATLPDSSV